MYSKEGGQTLMELIVVISVSVIVVEALVFATIASLRNASFSKNQAQATKLAQEGLERVRGGRDRDNTISTTVNYPGSNPSRNINKFSELFAVHLSHAHCNTVSGDSGPCYFYMNTSMTPEILTQGVQTSFELINAFKRQVLVEDQQSSYTDQKQVTSIVRWTDFSGPHESRLTTILRRI